MKKAINLPKRDEKIVDLYQFICPLLYNPKNNLKKSNRTTLNQSDKHYLK